MCLGTSRTDKQSHLSRYPLKHGRRLCSGTVTPTGTWTPTARMNFQLNTTQRRMVRNIIHHDTVISTSEQSTPGPHQTRTHIMSTSHDHDKTIQPFSASNTQYDGEQFATQGMSQGPCTLARVQRGDWTSDQCHCHCQSCDFHVSVVLLLSEFPKNMQYVLVVLSLWRSPTCCLPPWCWCVYMDRHYHKDLPHRAAYYNFTFATNQVDAYIAAPIGEGIVVCRQVHSWC